MSIFLIVVALILIALCIVGIYLGYKYKAYAKQMVSDYVKDSYKWTYSKWRHFCFLFRWFLIGKYHCDLPKKQLRVISLLNKLFWAFMITCIGVCLGGLIQWI